MLLALLIALNLADRIPARWPSSDPKSLEIVAETPVNCLLVEQWSAAFAREAEARGIAVLGVVRSGADVAEAARSAAEAGLAGLVLEGEFEDQARPQTQLALIELPPRVRMRFDSALAGTSQGVWPGVRVEVKAAATGGPWIDTNSGFLRFVRAATAAPIWIGVTPPAKTVLPVERYLQAIADAAFAGAHWIIALDEDFSRRLAAREATALRDWRRIGAHLRFYSERREAVDWQPYGQFALIQAPGAGALLSGGILDMIATKHTPVRAVPLPKLSPEALTGARLAVNVDQTALTDAQRESLRAFARSGGTLMTGPPGWKLPEPRKGQVTLEGKELEQIDEMWKGINLAVGRGNFGVRLFNVAGMLSNAVGDPSGKRVVLYLVNYTGYPVEAITVHMLGKYASARLYAPEQAPRDLKPYPIEEGTGIDVPQVAVSAALVLE